MNKKVLILTYDMIPYSFTWGGCQRMYYLAQKLLDSGSDVDVFALRAAKYNTYGKQTLPNVMFGESVPVGNEPQLMDSNSTTKKNKGLKGFVRKLAFKLDSILFNEITPGNGLLAYKKLKGARKKLEAQLLSKDYDLVIVSAPPFVVFNSIENIKKTQPQTKVIMDYRDPWNSWHTGNKLCERREKKLQEQADLIVCTNTALCEDMSQKYSIPFEKYQVVENGFMFDDSGSIHHVDVNLPHDKMNIVYTGAISFSPISDGYRDTVPLLEALGMLKHKGNVDIRLVFVGEANSDKSYLNGIKEKFGDQLLVIGNVNCESAKEYVKQADACLLLHTAEDLSGKFLISGKAYDYIQAKKFLFSISRPDSQHASIINRYGIGVNMPNDKEVIMQGLTESFEEWKKSGFKMLYDGINIMRFSRDFQLNRYKQIIEELL